MTATPPTVDVVLLSWNRWDDTLAAPVSVLTQEIHSMAVWVVDQESHLKQVAALRRLAADHPEVNFVALSHNIGVPAGRNIEIYSGIAEFVVCLDNDAVFDTPYSLSQAVDLLGSDPGLGAVAFRALDHSTRELDLGSWAYPRVHMEASRPVPVTRFVGVGHAVRRAAFFEAGGYDEDLFFCEEELDLSYRMIECGYRVLYDPSIVVLHKGSAEERIDWDRGRVYHQARNAVLVQHRHHRRLARTALVASGWLLRALYNSQGRQAIHGVLDAIRLLKDEDQTASLSTEARRYITEHDMRLRGSLLKRLRHDVLTGLPTRDESPARSS